MVNIQFLFYRFVPFIFPFLFSACVVHSDAPDFDKQAAAKARVELALGHLQQQDGSQAKLNLDKALSYAPKYYLVHAALGMTNKGMYSIISVHFFVRKGNIRPRMNNLSRH